MSAITVNNGDSYATVRAKMNSAVPQQNINTLIAVVWPAGLRPALIRVVVNWNPGDGGGVFRWDPTSTATPNGGTIIKETATEVGRWIREFDGPADVRFWNVPVGGTVDAAAGINAALSSGIKAFVAVGVFGVGSTIVLPPGVHLHAPGSTFVALANVNMFDISGRSQLTGYPVCDGTLAGWNKALWLVDGIKYADSGASFWVYRQTIIQAHGVLKIPGTGNGGGLHLKTAAPAGQFSWIMGVHADVAITGGDYHLWTERAGGWIANFITANHFKIWSDRALQVWKSTNDDPFMRSIDGNTFDVNAQPRAPEDQLADFFVVGGCMNRGTVMLWDWMPPGNQKVIRFLEGPDASANGNMFIGHFPPEYTQLPAGPLSDTARRNILINDASGAGLMLGEMRASTIDDTMRCNSILRFLINKGISFSNGAGLNEWLGIYSDAFNNLNIRGNADPAVGGDLVLRAGAASGNDVVVNQGTGSTVFTGFNGTNLEIDAAGSLWWRRAGGGASAALYLRHFCTTGRTQDFTNADGMVPCLAPTVPATATSPGVVGQIAVNATHFHWCYAPNAWGRTPPW